MQLKRSLRAVRTILGRNRRSKLPLDSAERIFRPIWHYLAVGSDRRPLMKRGQTNALVLQMSKVASTSIQAALCRRGVNAFHSHSLSSGGQHTALSRLLDGELSYKLVAHDLRRHIQHVAMHMMIRWYQEHKEYKGRRLKVITLARDPITHYPSGFWRRRGMARRQILAWNRARLNVGPEEPIDEAEAMSCFVAELASIVVEGKPSSWPGAYHRCMGLAVQRWPGHPVVASEVAAWLTPLGWFEAEMKPIFDIDVLAAPELRDRGWAECGNAWVDILVLKFESLTKLIPEIQRFFDLPELELPRENVTNAKEEGAEMANAVQKVLRTPIGQACARELRTSPYGKACGYDRLMDNPAPSVVGPDR